MTLNICVRDYRGIERASLHLNPICLLAGRNEQGKSSVAEAARAVLAGVPIPLPGVAKKDAALLVRDGAEEGQALLRAEHGPDQSVNWPHAEFIGLAESVPASTPYAVGLEHLFDLDAKARARALERYIDAEPSEKDLALAMADIGYAEQAIKQTWQAVSRPGGWDATWKKAREFATKLKGQWEAVTGEKYGAKKAEKWTPEGHPGDSATRETLQAAVDQALGEVRKAIGAAAVSSAEVERLRKEANAELEDPAPLRAGIEELKGKLKEAEAQRVAMPPEGKGASSRSNCPACGVPLVVEQIWQGPAVVKLHDEQAAEEAASKEARKRRAELDGKIANLKGQYNTLRPKLERLERDVERAEAARKRLEEIGEGDHQNSGTQVAEAERAEAKARAVLEAFDAKANAERLHTEIVKHTSLAGVLAPDGLRRRKLAAGLEIFNERLAGLCMAAKWPAVRLDENLQAHYGTRPLWAASGSGQYRARRVVQIAMAQIDGSAAVVIDEADILDFKGRNALFALLKAAKLRALICMTINKPALVPNLAEAGLGESVWVEGGIAEAINEEAVA